MKGVSSWNFDLAALKAQAACEPDDGSVPPTPTYGNSLPTIAEGPEDSRGDGEASGPVSRRSTEDAFSSAGWHIGPAPSSSSQTPTPEAVAAALTTSQAVASEAAAAPGAAPVLDAAKLLPLSAKTAPDPSGWLRDSSSPPAVMSPPPALVSRSQTVPEGSTTTVVPASILPGLAATSPALARLDAAALCPGVRPPARSMSAFASGHGAAAAARANANGPDAPHGLDQRSRLAQFYSEPAPVISPAIALSPGAVPPTMPLPTAPLAALAAPAIIGPPPSAAAAALAALPTQQHSPSTSSPVMSRESSSQGPLSAMATPTAPGAEKQKKHGRFFVYEGDDVPPPMSPPANRTLSEQSSGVFSRGLPALLSADMLARTSDPGDMVARIATGETVEQTSSAITGVLFTSSAPAIAPVMTGTATMSTLVSSTTTTTTTTTAAASITTAAAKPPAVPVPALGASPFIDSGDGSGAGATQKRGRFTIKEEEGGSSRGPVSKVPSSADLRARAEMSQKSLNAGVSAGLVLPKLLELHQQAMDHVAALRQLIDAVSPPAAEGSTAGTHGGAPLSNLGRKPTNPSVSLSRSTSRVGFAGGEAGKLTLAALLKEGADPMEVADRLVERVNELERKVRGVSFAACMCCVYGCCTGVLTWTFVVHWFADTPYKAPLQVCFSCSTPSAA